MPCSTTSGSPGRYGMWGSRNGTYLNGEKISAERVLRSGGDELRVGNSRLIFWEAKEGDQTAAGEETFAAAPTEPPPPQLTRRELEVLVVLCRPLVSDDPFPAPASVRQMAQDLFVTEQPSNSTYRTCMTSSPSPPRRESAGSVWPTRPSGVGLSPSPCCATAAIRKDDRTPQARAKGVVMVCTANGFEIRTSTPKHLSVASATGFVAAWRIL